MTAGDDRWATKMADLAASMTGEGHFQTADGMITLTNRHGEFRASAFLVEQAIMTFLPASVNDFRQLFKDLGYQEDYSDVHWVSEWLIILAAECPELIDNPEYRAPWKGGK